MYGDIAAAAGEGYMQGCCIYASCCPGMSKPGAFLFPALCGLCGTRGPVSSSNGDPLFKGLLVVSSAREAAKAHSPSKP